jgi:hypothetical protein
MLHQGKVVLCGTLDQIKMEHRSSLNEIFVAKAEA